VKSNEAIIAKRDKEINDIAQSIQQIATIFQDLQSMVIDQGTILDRIDYHVEMTVTHVEDAVIELTKGEKYQKASRTKMIILILILACALVLTIIIFKPRKSVQSTPPPPLQEQKPVETINPSILRSLL
jgi:syntaxin 16